MNESDLNFFISLLITSIIISSYYLASFHDRELPIGPFFCFPAGNILPFGMRSSKSYFESLTDRKII